ncbi:MAG: CRISPR-associated protein Cst1 [Anaerolineales bacterium]
MPLPNLDYTGHPLLDVGLATLTAFAHKRHPRQLTEDDLQKAADYMARNYVINPLKSFFTVAFPNSGYSQVAYDKDPAKRQTYIQNVLRAFGAEPTTEIDPFIGQPAAAVTYDVKGELPIGRAYRQHIPLTTGEGYINFHSGGDAGIPLNGATMLAFQAMPLGCAKVGGRLLAVHSDDPALMLHFARSFLETNQRNILAVQTAGGDKLPETSPRKARTTLIEHLLDAEKMNASEEEGDISKPLTAYYFTNSGQGAELEILPLPLEVGKFLKSLLSPQYKTEWDALVARGWQMTQAKKGEEAPTPAYNRLYEDLFSLPQDAPTFIRRYFLRRKVGSIWGKEDPTQTYNPLHESYLISWNLTQLFLKKVLLMEDTRIQHIRNLGDALATYIVTQNDKKFFNAFWMTRSYGEMRMALLRASNAEVRRGNPPIITLDQFLAIFEMGENIPHADWKLGRDLVLIRLFEQLHAQDWLQHNAAEIETLANQDDESE